MKTTNRIAKIVLLLAGLFLAAAVCLIWLPALTTIAQYALVVSTLVFLAALAWLALPE